MQKLLLFIFCCQKLHFYLFWLTVPAELSKASPRSSCPTALRPSGKSNDSSRAPPRRHRTRRRRRRPLRSSLAKSTRSLTRPREWGLTVCFAPGFAGASEASPAVVSCAYCYFLNRHWKNKNLASMSRREISETSKGVICSLCQEQTYDYSKHNSPKSSNLLKLCAWDNDLLAASLDHFGTCSMLCANLFAL